MATDTKTISGKQQDLLRLQAAAEAAGESFSAYMVRAGLDRWVRDQGIRYREAMDSLDGPDKAQLEYLHGRGLNSIAQATGTAA